MSTPTTISTESTSKATKMLSLRITAEQDTFLDSLPDKSAWLREAIDQRRFNTTVITDSETETDRKLSIIRKLEQEEATLKSLQSDQNYIDNSRLYNRLFEKQLALESNAIACKDHASKEMIEDMRSEYKELRATMKPIEVIVKTYTSKVSELNDRITKLKGELIQ